MHWFFIFHFPFFSAIEAILNGSFTFNGVAALRLFGDCLFGDCGDCLVSSDFETLVSGGFVSVGVLARENVST